MNALENAHAARLFGCVARVGLANISRGLRECMPAEARTTHECLSRLWTFRSFERGNAKVLGSFLEQLWKRSQIIGYWKPDTEMLLQKTKHESIPPLAFSRARAYSWYRARSSTCFWPQLKSKRDTGARCSRGQPPPSRSSPWGGCATASPSTERAAASTNRQVSRFGIWTSKCESWARTHVSVAFQNTLDLCRRLGDWKQDLLLMRVSKTKRTSIRQHLG